MHWHSIYRKLNAPLFMAVVFLISLVVYSIPYSYAQQINKTCSIVINNTGNYSIPNSCQNSSIYISKGVSSSHIYCSRHSTVSNVIFSDNTFNNTIFNCTFTKAVIKSLKNASNNLISPYGSYKTYFEDNKSNLAIGYYFTFIPRGPNGNYSIEAFAEIVPYKLLEINRGVLEAQQTTIKQIIEIAKLANYSLPRFGVYAPSPSSSTYGPIRFEVEAYAIYKNKTVNFNPYFFMCPFWGWDVLTYKEINITSNVNFSPTLIYPTMREYVQFPDNMSIPWSFNIIKYSHAPNMTLYFWEGYQASPEGKIMHIIHNITNGTYTYKRGIQKPGLHETIAVLKSPTAHEHDNSTTETYGVGLVICTYNTPPINISGYYTMAHKYLGTLNVSRFKTMNIACKDALNIIVPNVTINCLGGTINSTNISIHLTNANNTKLENCKIRGNALYAESSNNIEIYNSSIIANNESNIPFELYSSSLKLYNAKIIGYKKNPILNRSEIKYFNGTVNITTTTINYTSIYTTTTTITQSPNLSGINHTSMNKPGKLYNRVLPFTYLFILFLILTFGIYKLISLLLNRKDTKKGIKD